MHELAVTQMILEIALRHADARLILCGGGQRTESRRKQAEHGDSDADESFHVVLAPWATIAA